MRNMQYLKIVIYGPLKCKNILFRVFEASIYYAYDKKEKKLYVKLPLAIMKSPWMITMPRKKPENWQKDRLS